MSYLLPPNPQPVPELLRIAEAAELLSLSVDTLYKMAAAGELPAFKLGAAWRFRRSALLQWANDQTDQQTAARRQAAAAGKENDPS